MRRMGLAFVVVAFLVVAVAGAGQQPININALPAGARFCPAPGANNAEFMSSYFSIDAQTGVMTRHDAGSGPVGMMPEPVAEEQVLFVSPPISVESVYVPPAGGPALPPQTMATGVMPQPRQMYSPVAYAAPAPAPAPVYAPQVPVRAYPQTEYAQVQYPPQSQPVPYPAPQAYPQAQYAPQPYAQAHYSPVQAYAPAQPYAQTYSPAQPYAQVQQYPAAQQQQQYPARQQPYPGNYRLQPSRQYPQAAPATGVVATATPAAPQRGRVAR